MLHSPIPARPFQGREVYRHPLHVANVGLSVGQILDRARDQEASRASPLDRYLEGWAETDLDKILDATAPGYRFIDPLIGNFSGQSLHEYFDLLQDSLSHAGTISRFDLAFFLRGPMERSQAWN